MIPKKIYVAGKITGLNYTQVEYKFLMAQCKLELEGHLPIIPLHYCHCEWSWWRCMRICLALLKECDTIALLPDWKQSRGAKIEYVFAKIWRKKIIKL